MANEDFYLDYIPPWEANPSGEKGRFQAEGIESLRRHRHPLKSKYEDFMKAQRESIKNDQFSTWDMMKMPWQDPELGLFQSIAKHDKDYDPEEAQAFYERLTPNTPIGNLNKYVLLPALETADVGAGVAMKTLISAIGGATGLAADVYGTIPESVRDTAFAWNPYGAPTEGDMAMAPFLALEALGYNPQSIIARASKGIGKGIDWSRSPSKGTERVFRGEATGADPWFSSTNVHTGKSLHPTYKGPDYTGRFGFSRYGFYDTPSRGKHFWKNPSTTLKSMRDEAGHWGSKMASKEPGRGGFPVVKYQDLTPYELQRAALRSSKREVALGKEVIVGDPTRWKTDWIATVAANLKPEIIFSLPRRIAETLKKIKVNRLANTDDVNLLVKEFNKIQAKGGAGAQAVEDALGPQLLNKIVNLKGAKTTDKTGALAGTGTKTEVGKYKNIFENLGLNLRFDRTGSYRPETVIEANKILSQIKSPYNDVKHLKDNILDVNFDKHINKTLKQLKLDKDTYLTAKEIGLILGLKNVETWPHTMRTLTTTTTKSGEASAQAMLGIRKIDKRGVGQGPGVKYHLGDTIDSLKGLGEARVQRGITSSLNETLRNTQNTWTRNLFNKKFNEIATKAEKEAIKNLKQEQTIANKGLTKFDPNFQEIDHIHGIQVSLTAKNMGRKQFKKFLENKKIDILDIVDQQSWTKHYDEFLKTFNETDVLGAININNPSNLALIPKSEQFRTGLTKTTVFDNPQGGLQAKQENLTRVSNELADLKFLKANEKSISQRDLNYFIDTYGKTKNRKFALSKDTFSAGVTKRINDLNYDIKIMKKNINEYLDKAQELEAKQIKIPNLKSSKYPDPELFVKGGRVGYDNGGITGGYNISGGKDIYQGQANLGGSLGPLDLSVDFSKIKGRDIEKNAMLRFHQKIEEIDGLVLNAFMSKREGEEKKWKAKAEYEKEIAEGLTLSGYISKRQGEEKEWKAKAEYENEIANNLYFNAYGQTDGNEDQGGVSLTKYFKQGGRAGYKKGGRVKINPADYIEYYRDGTKLYKINSFIRDIARQIA